MCQGLGKILVETHLCLLKMLSNTWKRSAVLSVVEVLLLDLLVNFTKVQLG